MGTSRTWANSSIPSITIYSVIVPVVSEPVGILGAVLDPKMNKSECV